MPFGTTLPLSHDSSALPPRRDSASGPQGGPSSPIRLDRLPDEVLLHIASDLDATSILALGESCASVYVVLWRDHVRPLQLEGRLRWTTTITDLHAVLSNLGQCCRDGKQRLLELGWVQRCASRRLPAWRTGCRRSMSISGGGRMTTRHSSQGQTTPGFPIGRPARTKPAAFCRRYCGC